MTSIQRRDYWLCQAAGWGAFALIGIVSASFTDWEAALRLACGKTLAALTGAVLSHLWRRHLKLRGWLDHAQAPPYGRIVAGLSALSAMQFGIVSVMDFALLGGTLFVGNPTLAFDIAVLTLMWFVVFGVWTLCYAAALARRRASRFELEKLQLEVSVKDAELRALQAQVDPHFFFNSLNSIRALIYQDVDSAAHAVDQLAGMMRHSLHTGRSVTVSLADELAAVGAYLEIEKLRFDERLQLELDIDPVLTATRLPPMVLQTLVENAVKHGVERATGPCRVRISASRVGHDVRIEVANQGRLSQASASTRMGLANADRRLALQFGREAGCTLVERPGWVCATVSLPWGAA